VAATLEDGKITTGGGSAATEISLALRDFASSVGGREQMAVEAFADAIEVIPKTLATNAGLDAIDMLIELKKAHKEGKKTYGVDIFAGKPGDMRSKNVVEPMRVGTQAIKSATETTVMILRIDDVIAAKGSSGGGSGGGAGGGMGGGMPEY